MELKEKGRVWGMNGGSEVLVVEWGVGVGKGIEVFWLGWGSEEGLSGSMGVGVQ